VGPLIFTRVNDRSHERRLDAERRIGPGDRLVRVLHDAGQRSNGVDRLRDHDGLVVDHVGVEKLVALDTPEALRSSVGGDLIVIESPAAEELAAGLRNRLSLPAQVVEGTVRLETPGGHQWIARIVEEFPGRVGAIRLGKPTLEDVFVARTGHRFWREREEASHA